MENDNSSSLPWLQGNEQDFPLGAKAASFLLPATTDESAFKNDTFELPEWMESRENLGLSGMDLYDEVHFDHLDDMKYETFEDDYKNDIINGYNAFEEMEEDYSQTIRPEDMLVPLSELQPEKYATTPQGIGACTLIAAPSPTPSVSIPKVSIRVNRVQIPVHKPESQNYVASIVHASPSAAVTCQIPSFQGMQPHNAGETLRNDDENYNAEELINELVDMVNTEPNGLTNLISTFDASLVQAGMDDLLSQLESRDDKSALLEAPQWYVEAVSPVSALSPVPSFGSLSPQSTQDQSFHHLTPMDTIDEASIQHEESETSFSSVMSPVSEVSESLTSPSYVEDESDLEYSKPELHSYSRSPAKRKTYKSGRVTSFPEGRKERKKEQNKQAALRYRQKKKQEDDELLTKIKAEEERQKKLKLKYSSLKQELACLKKIMREVLIAKGTLSPKAFEKH